MKSGVVVSGEREREREVVEGDYEIGGIRGMELEG